MVPLCLNARGTARTTAIRLRCAQSRDRVRRAVLTALLLGLVLLPLFLEVVFASPAPREDGGPLLASRQALDFGARPVGNTTPPVTLAVANSAGVPIAIAGVTIGGVNASDFALIASTCRTLESRAVCTISARFTPTALGPRSARLVVSNSAGASALEIPLTGQGTEASARQPSRRTKRAPYRSSAGSN